MTTPIVPRDFVDEVVEQSFPASDPPEWTGTHAGAPVSETVVQAEPERATGKRLDSREIEIALERGAEIVWSRLRKRPLLGVALVAGAGLFVAELVGIGELAFAGALGYGAYQILKNNKPPAEAMREAMRLGRDF